MRITGRVRDLRWRRMRRLVAARNPRCMNLVYEWPQGFGRFALDAMNPNIGKLKAMDRMELEEILGTKLRVIYQHI